MVAYGRADLRAHELGRGVVRPGVQHDVGVRVHEVHAAGGPAAVELGDALLRLHFGSLQQALLVDRAGRGVDLGLLAQRRVVVLPRALVVVVHRLVARRHAEVRRSLEDVEMLGLLGDPRNGLDAGRTGADHADPLAGEVNAFVRPCPGVIGVAAKRLHVGEVRRARCRQAAGRHHAETRTQPLTVIGAHVPRRGALFEVRIADAHVELDVAPQIEAVGHMLRVLQDLGLGGEAFAPLPFLLQPVVEGIRVLHALDVAARPGVTVPVPDPADVAGGFEYPCLQPELAGRVKHVETAEAGPHDHDVEIGLAGGIHPAMIDAALFGRAVHL